MLNLDSGKSYQLRRILDLPTITKLVIATWLLLQEGVLGIHLTEKKQTLKIKPRELEG